MFLKALKEQGTDFLGKGDAEFALFSWVPGSNSWEFGPGIGFYNCPRVKQVLGSLAFLG